MLGVLWYWTLGVAVRAGLPVAGTAAWRWTVLHSYDQRPRVCRRATCSNGDWRCNVRDKLHKTKKNKKKQAACLAVIFAQDRSTPPTSVPRNLPVPPLIPTSPFSSIFMKSATLAGRFFARDVCVRASYGANRGARKCGGDTHAWRCGGSAEASDRGTRDCRSCCTWLLHWKHCYAGPGLQAMIRPKAFSKT
jgi:hypothetical protein